MINAVARQSDGRLIIGGDFTHYNGTAVGRVARLNADGSLDTTFNAAGSGTDGVVNALVVQRDGGVVVGGGFASMNGVRVGRIVRLGSDGAVDASFNAAGSGADDVVKSLALQADGSILVTGSFVSVNSVAKNGFTRLHGDGTLDAAFNSGGSGADAAVSGVALLTDATLVIGGAFTSVDGVSQPAFSRLSNDPGVGVVTASVSELVWQRSGSAPEVADATFELSTDAGTTWSTLGAGQRVEQGWRLANLTLPAGSSLIRVSGSTSGGASSGSTGLVQQTQSVEIAPQLQVELADGTPLISGAGSVDFGDIALGEDNTVVLTLRNAGNAPLTALSLSFDGLNGGEFTVIDSVPVELDAGAEVSLTFAHAPAAIGSRGGVLHVASSDPGTPFDVVLRGTGVDKPAAVTYSASDLAATSATLRGSVDTKGLDTTNVFDFGPTASYGLTLNASPATLTAGQQGIVTATVNGLQPGTTYHYRVRGANAAGSGNGSDLTFTTLSSDASLAGLVPSSGSLAPAFSSGVTAYTLSVANAVTSISVTPTTTDAGATLTVNGSSVASGGSSRMFSLAVGQNVITTVVTAGDGLTTQTYTLSVTRMLDTDTIGPVELALDAGLNGGAVVKAMAVQADGKIVVGGSFNKAGKTGVGSIARFNSDITRDDSFNQGGAGADGDIESIHILGNGKIIVAGAFAHFNGVLVNGIARLNADGSLDTQFNQGGAGADGVVTCVVVESSGKLIVGGAFTHFNSSAASRLVRLNADGSVDSSYNTAGSGADGTVLSLALQPDGRLVVAGGFTHFNNAARGRVARLNVDGTLDSSFAAGLNGANNSVKCAAVQPDGMILVGGDFTVVNGAGQGHIARLQSDGTLDSSFNAGGAGLDGTVRTMALQANGRIVIGGAFGAFNGSSVNFLARLLADGGMDTAFNAGTAGADGVVYGASLQADGTILVGGGFASMDGVPLNGFAVLSNDAASQKLSVAEQSFQWQISGAAPEASAAWFDLSTDNGQTWSYVCPASRTTGGWGANGVTLSANQGLLRVSARVPGGCGNASAGLVQQTQSFGFAPQIVIQGTDGSPMNGALSFGSIPASSSVPKTVVIANTGTGILNLTGSSITGDNASDYVITTPSAGTVAPGGTTALTITFTPGAVSSRSAHLVINSNDPQNGTMTVDLFGSGAPPAAQTTPATTVTSTSAVLTGAANNVLGGSTDVSFQLGTTTDYGQTVASLPASVTGVDYSGVSAGVTNLTPNTTYHFRLVATTSAGTSFGDDMTFTTVNNDASLASLGFSSGVLSPAFAPLTTSYGLSVPSTSAMITLTPTATDSAATVAVNGVSVASGQASGAIPLDAGANTITIVVTAADQTTTMTYTVSATRAPTAIESWRMQLFGSPNGTGPSADIADADGDGVTNLMEYAFGTDPTDPSEGGAPLQYTGTLSGGGTLGANGQPLLKFESTDTGVDYRALFVRRKDAASQGLVYTPQFSADLVHWQSSSDTPTVLTGDQTYETASVPFPFFINGKKVRFFRMSINRAP